MWLSRVIVSVRNTLQGVRTFLIIKQDLEMLVNCFKKSLSESIQSSSSPCVDAIGGFSGSLPLYRHFFRVPWLCNIFLSLLPQPEKWIMLNLSNTAVLM